MRVGPASGPRRSSRTSSRTSGVGSGGLPRRIGPLRAQARADLPRVRLRVARSPPGGVRRDEPRGLHPRPQPSPAAVLRRAQALGDHGAGGRSLQGGEGPRARARLVERPLSNRTINKTLTRLGQILDVAVRYELIEHNPVKTKVTKLRETEPRRARLSGEQVQALLQAAARTAPCSRRRSWRAGCASRADPPSLARRRPPRLARCPSPTSKTAAGERRVSLEPELVQLLREHKIGLALEPARRLRLPRSLPRPAA